MPGARFAPNGPLRGALRPPPDKSISHRAAMLAAMGEGPAQIEGLLESADTRATLATLERLGVEFDQVSDSAGVPGGLDLSLRGIGLRGPGRVGSTGDVVELDVANAGTLLRILPGWLAGQGHGRWRLDGDESIGRRPVDRVAVALRMMGAEVSCRDDRLPPLVVRGGSLQGVRYPMPVASAQVKSCVLVAGLLAEGATEVTEPAITRDHTERLLAAAGAQVETADLRVAPLDTGGAARRITIEPSERLRPPPITVPADFSSAAFLLVAALIVKGSRVSLERVGINPTRIGLLGILNRMGAAIEVVEDVAAGPEPTGTIRARSGPLVPTRVHAAEVGLAIDELPLVALAACFAEGETIVAGAEELRHKESDRIAAVVDGLGALGASIEALPDGFAVRGTGGLRGGTLDSRGDHRLAMLGAIAGLASREGVEVRGMESAAVSYPGFEHDLGSLLAR